MIVVSDASPLISLSEIGAIKLLPALYGIIHITEEVLHEVVRQGGGRAGAAISQADWIQVHSEPIQPLDLGSVNIAGLGLGELSSVALAVQMKADRLLIDDRRARRFATHFGQVIVGSVGVLATAHCDGLLPDIAGACELLINSSCYVNPNLIQSVLRSLGK